MPRGVRKFSSVDMKAALKAAKGAGLQVSRVDVDAATRKFSLRFDYDPEADLPVGEQRVEPVAAG